MVARNSICIFQDLDLGHYNGTLALDATITVSKNCTIIGEHVGINFVTQWVTKETVLLAKSTLIISFNSRKKN